MAIERIRDVSPVIHNITNYVVMNTTANALLALGASPVMAHAEEEVVDMVQIASALVINLGTLSKTWVAAMFTAAAQAAKQGIPIVLDPVGAGASQYRTDTARELVSATPPTIIRGNASEIMALCGEQIRTKGVDSTEKSRDAVTAAQTLHASLGSVVCVSGETDYIVGGQKTFRVRNGHPLMTRVTGLGCTATALCGAFAAVTPDPAKAAAQAMTVMGIAGEIAAEMAVGPGTLQVHFLDALYRLTKAEITQRLRLEC
ncbi:MAG: hydroxyethylthiazole kinase [Holophaga sp.]|nr:hydroxyethylthiazole kinase [Holophaga sp.]